MRCIKGCFLALAVCLVFLAAPVSAQQTYRWSDTNPTLPCSFTLQECIDLAVDGDTVEVSALNPIHEDLLIQAGITLKGVNGLPSGPLAGARLAAGRDITVQSLSDGGDSFTAKLENITLERGQIFVRHLNNAVTDVTLEAVQVLDVDPTSPSAAGILFEHAGSGLFSVLVQGNSVFTQSASSSPRSLVLFRKQETGTGVCYIRVNHNRLWNRSATANNLVGVDLQMDFPIASDTSQSDIYVRGNDIRGPGLASGVRVQGSNLSLSVNNNLIVGQNGTSMSDASISLYRNSFVGLFLVAVNNNTLADGYRGIRVLADSAPGTNEIQVSNNIFARLANLALSKVDGAGSITLNNHHNLFYQTGGSGVALGANTLYGNPAFRGAGDYRLTASSAARNAGLNPFASGAEAAGHFRIQEGTVDLGAYEFGSEAFRHTATSSNTGGSGTSIDRASLTGAGAAALRLFVTDNPYELFGSPVFDPNPLSTQFFTGQARWVIQHHDMEPMIDTARAFQVSALSEPSNSSTGGLFSHRVTANSLTTGHGPHVSYIDNPVTNNRSDALLFISHTFTPPPPLAVGQPNRHPVGVYYSAGTWRVFNLDYEPMTNPAATMPEGATFNVLVPPVSTGTQFVPNAFRAVAPAGLGSTAYFELDHPLLNGNPCATVHATHYWSGGAINRSEAGVFYHVARGRWRIWNRDGEAMPEGAQFNVYVDSGEAVACQLRDTFKLGTLFEDGFE